MIAPKSWLHIQTGVGLSSTLFAATALPRRSYVTINGEIRLHNPNSYSFKGRFVGVYYSLNGGEWKFKESDTVPNIGTTHKASYQTISSMIGLVVGASTVGRKHDYLYLEGFFAAGWAMKTVVTPSDSPYFTNQETPITRKERFEVKFGILLGVVAY